MVISSATPTATPAAADHNSNPTDIAREPAISLNTKKKLRFYEKATQVAKSCTALAAAISVISLIATGMLVFTPFVVTVPVLIPISVALTVASVTGAILCAITWGIFANRWDHYSTKTLSEGLNSVAAPLQKVREAVEELVAISNPNT